MPHSVSVTIDEELEELEELVIRSNGDLIAHTPCVVKTQGTDQTQQCLQAVMNEASVKLSLMVMADR